MEYNTLATDETVKTTISALQEHGIDAVFVSDAASAREQITKLIPEGSQIMTNASKTLDDLGISELLGTEGKYSLIKDKLATMDRSTQDKEMNQLANVPDYAIGSAAAVTTNGEMVWASNTGSQLGQYAYTASQVVLVISTKKIVPNLDTGIKRIEEHILPLENERVKIAYGMDHTNISKLLIIKKEVRPNRIHVILVGEDAGF